MIPELPIELPPGSSFIGIKFPTLECSMLHNEMRCRNYADAAIIYPTNIGYGLVALCQHCFDTVPEGWVAALESITSETHHAD